MTGKRNAAEQTEEAVWWLRTMNYIRTIPGTIYSEQLKELTKCFDCPEKLRERIYKYSESEFVDYLNTAKAAKASEMLDEYEGCFLKMDPVTSGVFTLPASREILDSAIWRLYKQREFPEPALNYNRYLYEKPDVSEDLVFEFPEDITSEIINDLTEKGFIITDEDKHEISFDFSVFRKKGEYYIYVRNFDLCKICTHFPDYSIGSLYGDKTVFSGETVFSSMNDITNHRTICGSLHFNCSSFERSIEFNYMSFICEKIDDSKVMDFREACFFGNVFFRNSVFENTSSNMEMSFEDAKVMGRLGFNNVDVGGLTINCFQTIFDSYDDETVSENQPYLNKVSFVNTVFGGDSIIQFSDSEFRSEKRCKVCFQNIQNMPLTKLIFAPLYDKTDPEKKLCPDIYLLIDNCEIQNTLHIGNVRQLSFHHSQNYSRIVSSEQWGELPAVSPREKIRQFFGRDGNNTSPRTKTKGIGRTKIVNKMLMAVYNNDVASDLGGINELNWSKGTDFLMLKENFSSQGMYDTEDVAFILFMEYKPQMDVKNKSNSTLKRISNTWLYKILYAQGKYGLSPNRVVASIIGMILFFTLVFFLIFSYKKADAFCVGNTLMVWDSAKEAYVDNLGDDSMISLMKSFLYSLENIVPFVSQFEAIDLGVCLLTAFENFLGAFLIGYFSVAVMRKILK